MGIINLPLLASPICVLRFLYHMCAGAAAKRLELFGNQYEQGVMVHANVPNPVTGAVTTVEIPFINNVSGNIRVR